MMCRNFQIPLLYSNIALSQIKEEKEKLFGTCRLASHLKVTASSDISEYIDTYWLLPWTQSRCLNLVNFLSTTP